MNKTDRDALAAIRARSENDYKGQPPYKPALDVAHLLVILEGYSVSAAAGGRARAAALTKKRRSEIARKAAKARWGKDNACNKQAAV